MKSELEKVFKKAEKELAQITNKSALSEWQIRYFGKKGIINNLTKKLPTLAPQERAEIGKIINENKKQLEEAFKRIETRLELADVDEIDVTAPAKEIVQGHLHIVTQTINRIVEIFEKIGFYRVRYPETEWDYYAFEALNMPKWHPARDEWETFFINENMVLTPHTSSGQVREMRKRKPPIRMLNISKCYRRQSDISHLPMFHQFEGLLIDKNVSIRELKGVLEYFIKAYYGSRRKLRLRPFHFRFTEPSFEVDISCNICNGLSCRMCKEGWLELGGAGMVHPKVLKAGGIEPSSYSGFAFGCGVERVLTISGVKIPDLRLIYQNDFRFLEQF